MGCSIALALASKGRSVQVLDKGPAAGAGTTSSSSAVVRFNYSTLDAVALAWESKHLWERWDELVGRSDESGLARFHRIGALLFDSPGQQPAAQIAKLFGEVGVAYEYLDGAELGRRYPQIDFGRYWPPRAVEDEDFGNAAAGQLSACYTPDAGYVDDPQLAAHNLMVAARGFGAGFNFGSEVTAVHRRGDRVRGVTLRDRTVISADTVVNAAGPHSSRVNALAGLRDDFAGIWTRPLRQEVHVVPVADTILEGSGSRIPAVVVQDTDLGTYFRPEGPGCILVGGLEPECDPLIWVDDPDTLNPKPSVAAWQAQTYRLAKRLPGIGVSHRPSGLASLYDVTPDWVPVYDRTSLDGFYVAIGTSGNQFKNAPMIGRLMAELIEACEAGHDHDRQPVRVRCELTGNEVNLGHYSRLRELAATSGTVLG